MNAFQDLIAIALLGSARANRPVQLPAPFGEILEPSSSPENVLLRSASVMGLAARAGYVPIRSTDPLADPAPEEQCRQIKAPETIALLSELVEEEHPLLLEEIFRALNGKSFCLPPRMLPRVLAICRSQPVLHQPLQQVLGQRGRWLAQQNSQWSYAIGAQQFSDNTESWEEGTLQDRVSFLRQLRKHDPLLAASLLSKTFSSETARDRAELLAVLAENLSASDTTFLEALWQKDRAKEVRQLAAKLLSRLSNNDFTQRVTAIMAELVKEERRMLSRTISISPPTEFSLELKELTVEEKPPAHRKSGERAWWLEQLISVTPLSWWQEHLRRTPQEIVAAAESSEWKEPVLAGLRMAVSQQPGEIEWVLALLKTATPAEALHHLKDLPQEEAELHFLGLLKESQDAGLAAEILEAIPGTLSLPLWSVVKEQLGRWLAQEDWRFRGALTELAVKLPRQALQEEISWPDLPLYNEAFTTFSRIQTQRKLLHQWIAEQ
jgi:hypothetical protein